MRRALALLALLLLAAAAPARLTEAHVRAFVAEQAKAWTGDVDAYFATFTPEARFTDLALANDNSIVPYGSSSVTEARALVRKSRSQGGFREDLSVDSVVLAPDGRGARVSAHVVSTAAGRRSCAQRIETVALTTKGLRATGQTDTIVRCRPAPSR